MIQCIRAMLSGMIASTIAKFSGSSHAKLDHCLALCPKLSYFDWFIVTKSPNIYSTAQTGDQCWISGLLHQHSLHQFYPREGLEGLVGWNKTEDGTLDVLWKQNFFICLFVSVPSNTTNYWARSRKIDMPMFKSMVVMNLSIFTSLISANKSIGNSD